MMEESDLQLIEKYLIPQSRFIMPSVDNAENLIMLGQHELGRFKLYMERRIRFIAKPVAYKLTNDYMMLTFPNGIEAILWYSKIKHKYDEFYSLMKTPLLWDVILTYKEPQIINYDEVLQTPAYDIADLLLSRIPPIDILIMGLGYRNEKIVGRVLIPRLLPLVRTEHPIHVWQFTQPNTAKTHIGVTYMLLFNWFYSSSIPSKAGLLYDARTGMYGYALISDGIIFDEVDKWSVVRVQQEELLTYLPTLMEQGVVVRPTTRRTFIGIIERRIPFMFFGNIPDVNVGGSGGRNRIRMYTMMWGDNTGALIDRIAVVDVCELSVGISDYVTGKVLPEAVLRAVVELMNKNVKYVYRNVLHGRLRRHADNIATALNVLGIDIDDETLKKVVLYGMDCLDRQ